jgi:hypothetical protein
MSARIGASKPSCWAVREVARLISSRPWAVYAWVRRYLVSHRPESLCDAERSGHHPVAPRITDARILRELRRNPLRLGYSTTGWTVTLLAFGRPREELAHIDIPDAGRSVLLAGPGSERLDLLCSQQRQDGRRRLYIELWVTGHSFPPFHGATLMSLAAAPSVA